MCVNKKPRQYDGELYYYKCLIYIKQILQKEVQYVRFLLLFYLQVNRKHYHADL